MAVTVVGAYVCLMATIVHGHVGLWRVAGHDVQVPWGIAIGVVAAYSVAHAADLFARLGSSFFALGWGVMMILSRISPGGSYLVGSDWVGWVFTLGTLGAVAFAVLRQPRLVS